MSIISTQEFQRKGHQVNIDMMNLDSGILGVDKASPGSIPSADKLTWLAQKNEWNHYYDTHIKTPDWIPFNDTSDLDTWITRIEDWKKRLAKWALLSNNAQARSIAAALPDSPAVIEHRENPPKGVPTWLYMVLGTALLASFGYSIASVARIGGR